MSIVLRLNNMGHNYVSYIPTGVPDESAFFFYILYSKFQWIGDGCGGNVAYPQAPIVLRTVGRIPQVITDNHLQHLNLFDMNLL